MWLVGIVEEVQEDGYEAGGLAVGKVGMQSGISSASTPQV